MAEIGYLYYRLYLTGADQQIARLVERINNLLQTSATGAKIVRKQVDINAQSWRDPSYKQYYFFRRDIRNPSGYLNAKRMLAAEGIYPAEQPTIISEPKTADSQPTIINNDGTIQPGIIRPTRIRIVQTNCEKTLLSYAEDILLGQPRIGFSKFFRWMVSSSCQTIPAHRVVYFSEGRVEGIEHDRLRQLIPEARLLAKGVMDRTLCSDALKQAVMGPSDGNGEEVTRDHRTHSNQVDAPHHGKRRHVTTATPATEKASAPPTPPQSAVDSSVKALLLKK